MIKNEGLDMKVCLCLPLFPGIAPAAMLALLCSPVIRAQDATATIKMTSPALQAGKPIPVSFTCEGENISPKLQWSDVPTNTKTLALICEDPDAPSGTWSHWILYNLPAKTTELAEKTPATESLPNGAKQGTNDFHRVGYSGPCPPPGKPHRYFFKLYALDTTLALKPRATRQELLHTMEGHILAQGQIAGTYQRNK